MALDENWCTVHSSGTPTYWPTDPLKIPDLLDFFVVKGLSTNFIDVYHDNNLSSDHTPVILLVSKKIIRKLCAPKLCSRQTDWNLFRETLANKINLKIPLKTPQDVEIAVEDFIKTVQESAWAATPDHKKYESFKYYPAEIRREVALKRKLRKL